MVIRKDRLDLYLLLISLSVWQMNAFGSDTRIFVSVFCGACVLLDILQRGNIAKNPAKILLPLILIILIGSVSYINESDNISLHNYLRDMYYITPVCLMFYQGFILSSKYSKKDICSIVVWANMISTINHFIKVLLNIQYITSLNYLRTECGALSHLNVIALIIVMFGDDYISERIKRHRLTFIASFIISEVLYFSRTGMLAIAVFVVIIYIMKHRTIVLRSLKVLLLLGICVLIVYFTNPNIVDSFVEKINYTLIEIGVGNNTTVSSSDMMFREREIVQAKREFEEGTLINKAIGYGIGHNIKLGDSGYKINIDGEEFTEAGMIHNGYYKALSISGIIGLILFVYFHINIVIYAWVNRKFMSETDFRFILSIIAVLLITAYTVIGIYAKGSNYPYIIALTAIIYGNKDIEEAI